MLGRQRPEGEPHAQSGFQAWHWPRVRASSFLERKASQRLALRLDAARKVLDVVRKRGKAVDWKLAEAPAGVQTLSRSPSGHAFCDSTCPPKDGGRAPRYSLSSPPHATLQKAKAAQEFGATSPQSSESEWKETHA